MNDARAADSSLPVSGQQGTLFIDRHKLKVTNLHKVLYPAEGTTKGAVIEYYVGVSEAMLPHLADRPATRKRWPDGVSSTPFFEKNSPRGTPDWVRVVTLDSPGSSKNRDTVSYPVIDGLAALVWVANLAALELHVPQWTVGPRGGVRHPNRFVVDLDPGAPAGLAECIEVAHLVKERLAADGLDAIPVTSGSKGMQLYAPISGQQSGEVCRTYAHELAKELEGERSDLVLSSMAKAQRTGKVFLDWSQNNPAKTTVCPYSLRGREHPHVAAPRSWDELADPSSVTQVHMRDLQGRLEDFGELAESLTSTGPKLPT